MFNHRKIAFRRMLISACSLIFHIAIIHGAIYSQVTDTGSHLQIILPDTSALVSSALDSQSTDTTISAAAADTSDTTAAKKAAEIDTIITYQADSIYFGLEGRITVLVRNAEVHYRDFTLKAGKITVNWDQDLIIAEPLTDTTLIDTFIVKFDTLEIKDANHIPISPDSVTQSKEALKNTDENANATTKPQIESISVPDSSHSNCEKSITVKSDTLDLLGLYPGTKDMCYFVVKIDSIHIAGIDTIQTTGKPVFIQGGEELEGEHMTYNLKSKKGMVLEGRTAYGDGYYQGEKVKRMDDKVLNVGVGYYTTCEQDTPHYHFYGTKMKLVVKDKVVAKPVTLYFGKVPAGIVPFAIISSKSGRHSGIIVPYYNETASQGRYFRNLGYYFAPSDYGDARAAMSYFEKDGVLFFDGNARYSVRYLLRGNLNGSYTRMDNSLRWDLRFMHDHNLTPTSSVNVNANFVSDKQFYQDVSSNVIDRMNRTLRSDATFRKSFRSINASSSLNLHHDENLDNGETTTILPQFNFSLGQRSFFPKGEEQEETYWYNKIYYSARSNFTNRWNKDLISLVDSSYKTTKEAAVKDGYSLSSSQELFHYINITPAMNINQDFTDYRLNYRYNDSGDSIISEKESGIFVRHTYNFNLSMGTKLYGLFPANFWSITGFRHVLSPSLSFRFQPDFSERKWGYYQYLEDASGEVEKRDHYAGQTLFGATPSSKAKSMSISLGNLFQMRREIVKDSSEEVQKLDLFTLNFATSYDFEKDSLNWGNLSTTFRSEPVRGTQIGPLSGLSFDLSATHSFYATSPGGGLVNKFYFEDGNLSQGKILRLTNLNLGSTLLFAPMKKAKKKAEEEKIEFLDEGDEWGAFEDTTGTPSSNALVLPATGTGDRFAPVYGEFRRDIPWNLTSSLRYYWSRANPTVEPTKNIWLENSLSVKLSQNWSVSYTNRVDLVNGQIVTSGFSFYRDLHCWEGSFSWNPTGVNQGFFLKINVKSPSLQDLKLEQRRGSRGILGY